MRNGFSMNFSIRGSSAWWSGTRMVRVTALDIQVNLRNLMAMLEDSMTSVKTLYRDSPYFDPRPKKGGGGIILPCVPIFLQKYLVMY